MTRRVCHVTLTLRTGGMERLIVEFARLHDRARFEPHFVVFEDLGQPAEDVASLGVPIHHLQSAGTGKFRRLASLARLFRVLRPDVVHTHNSSPHFYGSMAARWAGAPAVVHTRHGRALGGGRSPAALFWLGCRLADRVVSVSDDTDRLSRSQGRLSGLKARRIWNGVDLGRFAFREPAADPVMISVGRLEAVKDVPTLLRATALAVRSVPQLRLLVVGEGSERPMLEALAHELGLDGRVCFLGERADVPELLAAAGLFVSSSSSEGISLTLLEAMAIGLPILATSVGGNPEVVVDGETGRLVPPADPVRLAGVMVELLREPDHRAEMGRRGRARVEKHFNVRQMVREYEELYDEVLASGR